MEDMVEEIESKYLIRLKTEYTLKRPECPVVTNRFSKKAWLSPASLFQLFYEAYQDHQMKEKNQKQLERKWIQKLIKQYIQI